VPRSPLKGAGPRLALVLLLDGVAEPLADGCEVLRERARGLRWPASWWRLWSSTGWREVYRHKTVASGQRAAIEAAGGYPRRRSLPAWRRCWAKADKGRTMTASEWSRRTGEPIPDWLRGD